MKKVLKKVALVCLVGMIAMGSLMAQGRGEQAASGPKNQKPYNIAVIIKATDSDFWQYLLVGALNYAVEHPDVVKVTTYGPPSEADIDRQVTILENVISTNPDAIVISSTSSDATVPALEKAYAAGIKIITVDNKVNTDKVHTFLATDNVLGGSLAADKMVEYFKKNDIPTQGRKVAIVDAMAGVQVLTVRTNGFINRMKQIAPEIEIIAPRYVDNDILKAMNVTNDLITTHGDSLIGIFGNNNHSADGVARSVAERNLGNKIIVTAYDSDPEEVAAIKSGVVKAIMVQDPYGMGYKGVDFAVRAIEGATLPEYVDTGVVIVEQHNVNDSAVQGILDPFTMKKY
ncbi:ABC transporter substrate-binding protein [Parasphaerochaeta coccoides]|uniref:Periplasmic binding protein/LacI transcriptional regulator n=1 Tax=Parasphaerochaeta coccoides (strain ATCC BAA-1237 / DSM 17374 / SPN1) TaxID=760011 RepID=F4GI97_PARC1|nr:ABC transporter substrate-binding protein [Parasphaerochaeta coccoides]AEC01256.1 periplasmic binding protein/LacI transcriptional regulator [Parasphaerochaeta coccoides DSM 17374]